MQTNDLALLAYTVCNSFRIFAYLPQIVSAVRDNNGCSSISYSTWVMFLVAHTSAVAYAVLNVQDINMAIMFAGNAVCCLAILAIVYCKRQSHFNAGHVHAARTFDALIERSHKGVPPAPVQ